MKRYGETTPIWRGGGSGSFTVPPSDHHPVSLLIEGAAHLRRLTFERT